jgi:diaminopimelate decarboxylase
MKALSNVAVLQLLKEMGAGLDTVSIQEVQLGLHAGYEPEKIFYTPNGVSLEEIEEVNAMGVQINIDNLSILEQFGTKHPNVPVCIRINPHVMAGGNTNTRPDSWNLNSSIATFSSNRRKHKDEYRRHPHAYRL